MDDIIGDFRPAKNMIRQRILAARIALGTPEAAAKSQMITAVLDTLNGLSTARVIMGYAPFRNEVDVMPWLLAKLEAGVKILLPRVMAETGELEAVPLVPDDQMSVSKLGVSEPLGSGIDPREIEAVIVPGVVFDRQGYRLGYGKGFYDRFLPRLKPATFCCGVAYEIQIVDELPREAHDYRLDCLVSEKGVNRWS